MAARAYICDQHAANWDDLLGALSRSADLRAAFSWLRIWPLDAPETQKQKYDYYESQKWSQRPRPTVEPKPEPAEVWQRDLENLASGTPTVWLNLAHNLFYRIDREAGADEKPHDVRTSPGWSFHNQKARDRIIAGARRLLREVPGNPHHPVGGQSRFDELAYRALYLLKDEIVRTPELADAVRRHWLPIIFDEFSNADPHHFEMMAIGYRLDGETMRTLLKHKILRDSAQESGYCYKLREFASCWDQPLANLVIDLCATEVANPTTIGCVMDHLAEHAPESAWEAWRRLGAACSTEDRRFVVATASLASWRLFEGWEEIWPVLKGDIRFAQLVFQSLDRTEQRAFAKRPSRANERHFADLYLYLRELFPPSEDPPTPTGRAYTPTGRMEIARFRDGWPAALAALATEAAADELLRIANALPPADGIWIRWRWREAVVAARRQAWRPLAPGDVLALMRKADKRWLADEDDLLALVMESLGRLDNNLTSQPNSQRIDFWDTRRGPNEAKYFSPRDETDMSRRITTWLQSDLAPSRGISIQREVQVQWNRRTDIEVRAVTVDGNQFRPLELVIEVKGCWHPKIRSAHEEQLALEYLQRAGKTHGIYLVVWTQCTKWNDPTDKRKPRLRAKTLPAARAEVDRLVAEHDGVAKPTVIRGMMLDARL